MDKFKEKWWDDHPELDGFYDDFLMVYRMGQAEMRERARLAWVTEYNDALKSGMDVDNATEIACTVAFNLPLEGDDGS